MGLLGYTVKGEVASAANKLEFVTNTGQYFTDILKEAQGMQYKKLQLSTFYNLSIAAVYHFQCTQLQRAQN